MSKFACKCGFVISTSAYPNSVEGWLYGVEGEEEFEPKIEEAIAGYFDAKAKNQVAHWLATHFSKEYPQDLSDVSVISDLITVTKRGYLRDVLECPSCGRLHVQEMPGMNVYRSYLPEGSAPGILKKRPNQSPEPTAMSVTPPAAQESRQP